MEADGWDHEAHVLGVLPAENHDAADELAAAVLVHQGDQAVAELHLNGVHGEQPVHVVDVLIVVGFAGHGQQVALGRLLGLEGLHSLLSVQPAAHQVAQHGQSHAHDEQRNGGCAGNEAQDNQHQAGSEDGPGLPGKLLDHIGIQAAIGHRPGYDHAGGGGNHQGGELGD